MRMYTLNISIVSLLSLYAADREFSSRSSQTKYNSYLSCPILVLGINMIGQGLVGSMPD